MSLNGIDISNWQKDLDLSKVPFDFAIMKATEGIGFVDKSCDRFVQYCIKAGKPWGFYHFARPTNDAVEEAQYFVKHTKNYFGHGLPVLDWEAENKNDVGWAKRWLDEVNRQTGTKPAIYMSAAVVNAYDWSAVVAAGYSLWVAQWRDKVPDYDYDMKDAGPKPNIKHWKDPILWQWTSIGHLSGYGGSLDFDVFYGSKEDWQKLTKAQKDEEDEKDTPDSTVDDIARAIRAVYAKYAEDLILEIMEELEHE